MHTELDNSPVYIFCSFIHDMAQLTQSFTTGSSGLGIQISPSFDIILKNIDERPITSKKQNKSFNN